jgi:hypothetical protein
MTITPVVTLCRAAAIVRLRPSPSSRLTFASADKSTVSSHPPSSEAVAYLSSDISLETPSQLHVTFISEALRPLGAYTCAKYDTRVTIIQDTNHD